MPVISVFDFQHAAFVEDVDQGQESHSQSVPGRTVLDKVPIFIAKEVSLRNVRHGSYVDILT